MNQLLWVLQGALAVMFATAGVMKASEPKDELATKLPWVEDYSGSTVKLIGIAELAAAMGLLLPGMTGIAVLLTPIAALGIVVLMALAVLTHARRGESTSIAFNIALLLLGAFVAWGRFGTYSL